MPKYVPQSLVHVHDLARLQQVRGRVPQGGQGPRRLDPFILVLDRLLPVGIRQNVLDGLHIRDRELDEAVEVGEVPRGTELPKLLLQCAVQSWRRDELVVVGVGSRCQM